MTEGGCGKAMMGLLPGVGADVVEARFPAAAAARRSSPWLGAPLGTNIGIARTAVVPAGTASIKPTQWER